MPSPVYKKMWTFSPGFFALLDRGHFWIVPRNSATTPASDFTTRGGDYVHTTKPHPAIQYTRPGTDTKPRQELVGKKLEEAAGRHVPVRSNFCRWHLHLDHGRHAKFRCGQRSRRQSSVEPGPGPTPGGSHRRRLAGKWFH